MMEWRESLCLGDTPCANDHQCIATLKIAIQACFLQGLNGTRYAVALNALTLQSFVLNALPFVKVALNIVFCIPHQIGYILSHHQPIDDLTCQWINAG